MTHVVDALLTRLSSIARHRTRTRTARELLDYYLRPNYSNISNPQHVH